MPLARHILVTTSESFSSLAGQPSQRQNDVIIIDQPEDDLDNQTISTTM